MTWSGASAESAQYHGQWAGKVRSLDASCEKQARSFGSLAFCGTSFCCPSRGDLCRQCSRQYKFIGNTHLNSVGILWMVGWHAGDGLRRLLLLAGGC